MTLCFQPVGNMEFDHCCCFYKVYFMVMVTVWQKKTNGQMKKIPY